MSIQPTFRFGPCFPRHGLVDGFRFSHLASEFRIGQPLANDLTQSDIKALGIGHLPIVKPESLFVDVVKQVERLNASAGAVQLPLTESRHLQTALQPPVHSEKRKPLAPPSEEAGAPKRSMNRVRC